jgi:hypothetical protein
MPGTDNLIKGAFKSEKNLSTNATALEGLRRFITGDSPRLPFGTGHEMILGNTHMQLPDGVTINPNPDGTCDILRDGKIISDNVKLNFTPNGDLTDASKDLLAKDKILTTFAQTGGKVTEHIKMKAEEYVNKHPELTTKIHREWMGNNTPMYPDPDHPGHLLGADLNELRTQFGGINNTGIDAKGNFVFNVQHMTNDGSFQDGLSPVMAHDEMKKGGLTLLLSVTRGLQHTVFKVPIDANGNAIIDPKSAIGQMMFQNVKGHAVFTGQFAEIGHLRGLAPDGGENMQILGTHIGTGHPGEAIEDIIKDTTTPNVKLDAPADWDYEVPFPIPIGARRPLEKGTYREEKTNDKPVGLKKDTKKDNVIVIDKNPKMKVINQFSEDNKFGEIDMKLEYKKAKINQGRVLNEIEVFKSEHPNEQIPVELENKYKETEKRKIEIENKLKDIAKMIENEKTKVIPIVNPENIEPVVEIKKGFKPEDLSKVGTEFENELYTFKIMSVSKPFWSFMGTDIKLKTTNKKTGETSTGKSTKKALVNELAKKRIKITKTLESK